MHVDNPSAIPEEEVANYVARTERLMATGDLPDDVDRIVLTPMGDEIIIHYFRRAHRPFDRIRRITGYLVGTVDRWNDGKKAELRDRVKHGMEGEG